MKERMGRKRKTRRGEEKEEEVTKEEMFGLCERDL